MWYRILFEVEVTRPIEGVSTQYFLLEGPGVSWKDACLMANEALMKCQAFRDLISDKRIGGVVIDDLCVDAAIVAAARIEHPGFNCDYCFVPRPTRGMENLMAAVVSGSMQVL